MKRELLRRALSSAITLSILAANTPVVFGDTANVLPDGTPIRLRLNRTLSSAEAKPGETVDFEVLDEVRVGDVLVIKKGSPAIATVTEAVEKRRMGRAGKLNVNIDYVRLANGERAALRAIRETNGGSNVGKMTGAIVATSIVFFPAAPFFLFAKGKDVVIPKGTEITAFTNGDMTVDMAKFNTGSAPVTMNAHTATPVFQQQPAPAPAPSAAGPRAMTNADVLAMKGAGLSDDLIAAKVRSAKGSYKLDSEDLIQLKKSGVSDTVIRAMLEAPKS